MQSTCLQKSVTNREPTIVCRYLVITDKLLIDVINSTIHLHAQAVVQFALKLMKLTYIIKTRPVSECQTTTPIIRCDVVVEILHLVFCIFVWNWFDMWSICQLHYLFCYFLFFLNETFSLDHTYVEDQRYYILLYIWVRLGRFKIYLHKLFNIFNLNKS